MTTKRKSVTIPPRLDARPKWHGLPIPYIAFTLPNGDPDFRVIDEIKHRRVIADRICQLCGIKLGRHIYFTGGPRCAEQNIYYEPAIHLDCLIYAMQVCPFICGTMQHAPMEKVIAEVEDGNPGVLVHGDDTYTTEKDEWWVITHCTGYTLGQSPGGTLLLQPTGIQNKSPRLHAQSMKACEWEVVRHYLFVNGTHG